MRLLITEADVVKAHVPSLTAAFDDETIEPQVRRAQRDYILPVLGEDLMEALLDYIEGSGTDEDMDELLELVQEALANLAVRYALPYLSISVADHALQITQTENFRPPYQWQVGDLSEALHLAGMNAIEAVYAWLEENEPEEWVDSEARTTFNETILRTAAEFNTEYKINGSRITYVDLRPALKRAWLLDVVPVIGVDFAAQLLEYLNGNSDSEQTVLDDAIEQLRPALAHLAIGRAEECMFRYVNGALLSTRTESNRTNDKVDTAREVILGIRRTATTTGHDFLSKAHKWLDDHAALLTIYADGEGFREDPDAEPDLDQRLHNSDGFTMV